MLQLLFIKLNFKRSGHGGRQIVDFLEENLEKNIAAELQQNDNSSIPEKLKRAYLLTDMQSRQLNHVTAGSTSISALIKSEVSSSDGARVRRLFVANVGDSRAILIASKKQPGG